MRFKPTQAATNTALAAITLKANGKPNGIPAHEMVSYVFGDKLPPKNGKIRAALDLLDQETEKLYRQKNYPVPGNNAYNNCHGRWSEALFAILAWNTLAEINAKRTDGTRFIFVQLPDRKEKEQEWTSLLLNDDCKTALNEFVLDNSHPIVNKSAHNRLLLIASNPDAVILKYDAAEIQSLNLPLSVTTPFSTFDKDDLSHLDNMYAAFSGKVLPSKNLVALLSLKSSLRGDRRYQFVREGDNAKSILMYLFTRKADKGLSTAFFSNRFYCFSFEETNQQDLDVMDSAMSAYVSSPIMDPIWAVDKLYECTEFSIVQKAIKEIIRKST